jgi:hypothetical protein
MSGHILQKGQLYLQPPKRKEDSLENPGREGWKLEYSKQLYSETLKVTLMDIFTKNSHVLDILQSNVM